MDPADVTPVPSRYLHGYSSPVLTSHRERTAANSAGHLLPHLRPGLELLDVGSGAGTIAADLARIVGPEHLTAIEVSEEAAAITRAELGRQGVAGSRVVVGDARALPFADATFDVVHVHQVLQHIPEPVQALREIRRVLHPGGLAAVRESDYEGFRWWPDSPGLDRWRELYLKAARAGGGTPDAGRRLLTWAREAGFGEVTPSSSTTLYATAEGRAAWGGAWAGRVLAPPLATTLRELDLTDQPQLEELSCAWTAWSEESDGWFSLLHGEILARY
ncbi:methyltransferase domain-containing protein [Brachybacterium sp. Marseille-Q7125]|uniref:methyltransferase domain-containing protein n=1 Tax=Brachybacterium sp. Marseille-Q7125 TaxID=2932815 RepID=UPI001FF60585|nr:methyltransferase domain-containing protein [Brachybacterium sp. Marseille-Q7125]